MRDFNNISQTLGIKIFIQNGLLEGHNFHYTVHRDFIFTLVNFCDIPSRPNQLAEFVKMYAR